MKKLVKLITTASFLIAIAVMTVGSAHGQSLASPIKINIPFDFQVSDKSFPAGEYSVSRLLHQSSDSVLKISSVDGKHSVVRLTIPAQTLNTRKKGTQAFHRYGEQYFLFQVWPAGAQTGRVLPKSRSEREAEQKIQDVAGVQTPRIETVDVVAGP